MSVVGNLEAMIWMRSKTAPRSLESFAADTPVDAMRKEVLTDQAMQ